MDENEKSAVKKTKSEIAPRHKAKHIAMTRREPSIVVSGRKIVFVTPDKTTCVECDCFPKEDPYQKRKKLNPCQKSPLTLYELAASVLDKIKFPEVLNWTEDQVVNWMMDEVGLPEYRECILDNHIDGMRLLMFEDPSKLANVNIRNFDHIKSHFWARSFLNYERAQAILHHAGSVRFVRPVADLTVSVSNYTYLTRLSDFKQGPAASSPPIQVIVSKIRQLYGVDFVKFSRSVGLPPRKPITHCTWFKSRTGPNWGIRKNWTRCDILRWMKIIVAEPLNLDHWDMVWYQKPDFPKVKFAKIEKPKTVLHIPRYKPEKEECKEYLVRRKFRFLTGIPEDAQVIWMEHRPGSPSTVMEDKKKMERKVKITVPIKSRLEAKKINLIGLKGNDLILARRKMPKPKFLVHQNKKN